MVSGGGERKGANSGFLQTLDWKQYQEDDCYQGTLYTEFLGPLTVILY